MIRALYIQGRYVLVNGRMIFCRTERLAYRALLEITNKFGAHVYPHLRIKEVANRDWIAEDSFDLALKGHIDFTVAIEYVPVLALELDGRFHQSLKAKERDAQKDALCDSLGIPLVRFDYGHTRYESIIPVMVEFIEMWLTRLKTCESTGAVSHRHALTASPTELQKTLEHCAALVSAPATAAAKLEISTSSLARGYSESIVRVTLGSLSVDIGKGRSKVPAKSLVCGRYLAERLAMAQALSYVRTAGGTVPESEPDAREAMTVPVVAACPDCPALPPTPARSQQMRTVHPLIARAESSNLPSQQ